MVTGQARLFSESNQPAGGTVVPLAARMRPRTLDEILGQEHLLASGRALRRALEADKVPSMVLWGPPGSGKTTLAEVIARLTRSRFIALSAVTAGVADLRKVVEVAGSELISLAVIEEAVQQRALLYDKGGDSH